MASATTTSQAAPLTPQQYHALFDILTHQETYSEIENFKFPGTVSEYGPPFQDSVKSSCMHLPPLVWVVLCSAFFQLGCSWVQGFELLKPIYFTLLRPRFLGSPSISRHRRKAFDCCGRTFASSSGRLIGSLSSRLPTIYHRAHSGCIRSTRILRNSWTSHSPGRGH